MSLGLFANPGVIFEGLQVRSGPAGPPVGMPWGTESAERKNLRDYSGLERTIRRIRLHAFRMPIKDLTHNGHKSRTKNVGRVLGFIVIIQKLYFQFYREFHPGWQ